MPVFFDIGGFGFNYYKGHEFNDPDQPTYVRLTVGPFTMIKVRNGGTLISTAKAMYQDEKGVMAWVPKVDQAIKEGLESGRESVRDNIARDLEQERLKYVQEVRKTGLLQQQVQELKQTIHTLRKLDEKNLDL